MRSQEMYSLMQSGKEIRVALETDGERIGGLLNQQSPLPVNPDEPAFDYTRHMQHLSAQLGSAIDQAVEAEDEHATREIQLSRLRDERDGVAGESFNKLLATRQGLEGLFRRGGFELVNVSGETPRVPERLHEQLGQSVKLLRTPAVELRQMKVEGFAVDLDAVAGDLETRQQQLRTAIDRVDSGRKLAQGSQLDKRKAIDELRRTILWVGRTSEGLFHLAGESELAERIRSSTRRPVRASEKAAAAAAEETATGDASPAADEPSSESVSTPRAPAS